MDNKTAVVLGLLILGAFLLEYYVLQSGLPIYLARKFVDLVEQMAIWR